MIGRDLLLVILVFASAVGLLALPAGPTFAANTVTNVQMTPPSPDFLSPSANVSITFDYETDEVGGARIFFRPFTQGSLSPGYSASGSTLYPLGVGSGAATFTINSASVTVDQVRIQMFNEDQSVMILEAFLPVTFYFGPPPITNIQLTPASPANLVYGQNVTVDFDYETAEAGGVRIFARPFSSGGLTPGYSASGSSLYPVGMGSGSGTFTVNGTSAGSSAAAPLAVNVDQIRFQMLNDNQSILIAEFFIPVTFTFDTTVSAEPTTWGRIKALY